MKCPKLANLEPLKPHPAILPNVQPMVIRGVPQMAVEVECPDCKVRRWMACANVRVAQRRNFTGYCCKCVGRHIDRHWGPDRDRRPVVS